MGRYYNGRDRTDEGIARLQARWRARERARHATAMHFHREWLSELALAKVAYGHEGKRPTYRRAQESAMRAVVVAHPVFYDKAYAAELAKERRAALADA